MLFSNFPASMLQWPFIHIVRQSNPRILDSLVSHLALSLAGVIEGVSGRYIIVNGNAQPFDTSFMEDPEESRDTR